MSSKVLYSPLSSSFFFSLPHCKALFISPCWLHVDMENILGWNSNDSYIHTLSVCSVFVFKLHFSPNRVYKPCLARGDHSLPSSLDSKTLGCTILQRSCYIFIFLHGKLWWDLVRTGTFLYGQRLLDIGDGNLASVWVFRHCGELLCWSALNTISGIWLYNC